MEKIEARYRRRMTGLLILGGILAVAFFWKMMVCAEENTEADTLLQSYLKELNLGEIDRSLTNLVPGRRFRFREVVQELVHGRIPLDPEELKRLARDAVCSELSRQRIVIVQILLLTVASAVFTNFIRIFRKEQISEISFYIIYLLLLALLMQAYQGLGEMAKETMGEMLHFMRILLPVYLTVAALAAGSVTAAGFYEATLIFITLVQTALNYILLPGISGYLLLLLLDHFSQEEYFSRLAQLLKTVLLWIMKTLIALVIGVQTVQGLLLPAIDSLKNTVLHRSLGAIPMLGNTLNAVTETVLGTAVLLKNAVGLAGVLVILLICAVPILQLLVCTFLYKLLGAAVQPVAERRITECISGLGDGIELLLRVMAMSGMMFLITLAMVTSSIRV
ncbi:MAG: stage III sporulation protein AE [Eubacteriales bacterium]|nr:stage III sporulation protein AE [Eubacteriales bacterium]